MTEYSNGKPPREGDWSWFENRAIPLLAKAGGNAALVYVALLSKSRSRSVDASQAQIAKMLDVHVRSVTRAIQSLIDVGLIRAEKRRGRPDIVEIVQFPPRRDQTELSPPVEEVGQNCQGGYDRIVGGDTTELSDTKEEEEEESKNGSLRSAPLADQMRVEPDKEADSEFWERARSLARTWEMDVHVKVSDPRDRLTVIRLARLTVAGTIPEMWTASAISAICNRTPKPGDCWGYFYKTVVGYADGDGFNLNRELATLRVPPEHLTRRSA